MLLHIVKTSMYINIIMLRQCLYCYSVKVKAMSLLKVIIIIVKSHVIVIKAM